MTNWQGEYKKKLVSADEAVSHVKSGDRVVFTPGREAFAIGLALAARKEELKGVKVFTPSPGYDFGWYDVGWSDSFEVSIMMPTAVCQDAVDAILIALNPGTLIPFEEGPDAPKSDVLLTEVSTPDERGFCSFGASVWNKHRVIAEAKLTIAEVNPNLIRTYGDNYVHVSEIDYFVEHLSKGGAPGTGTLAGRAVKETDSYLYNVAQNVSELIRDGDTIQIGVGRTTEPLVMLGIFKGRRDLGWHSEATPGGVISLVREGVINGSRKTLHPGKCVVTSLGGGTKYWPCHGLG
jgi:4-hydroxybutyrate CoA-transferase